MSRAETVHMLAEAGRAAPSADNSQPWRFSWNEDRFFCHYGNRNANDPFGAAGHATLIGVGAVAENLHQRLGAEIEPVIEDLETGSPYFSVSLPPAPMVSGDMSHPLFARHTNRFPYRNLPIPMELIETLEKATEGQARLVLIGEQASRDRFASIAETCCQARFCNRDLHEWLMSSLRWPDEFPESCDGLDVNTLSLPPGGRQFMRFIRPWSRFERMNRWLGLYRLMAKAEVLPLRQGPLVACVVGENTPRGSYSAGRLMERAWIHVNNKGWAVHPYYVIADQASRLARGILPARWGVPVSDALSKLGKLLGIAGHERIHMALRIGMPTVDPPRSRRMSVDRLGSPDIS